jgi:hypothetical protein
MITLLPDKPSDVEVDDEMEAGEQDSSSTDEKSDSIGGLSTTSKNADEIVQAKEEALVFRARFLFLSVLLLAAATLGTTVYLVSTSEEKKDFEAQVRTLQ